MQLLSRPWGAMHIRIDGPEGAPGLVFANSLGTDLRIWDRVVAALPGWRIGRFDKPGHGLSDLGATPGIDDMAEDAAALIDHMGAGPVVFVGLSIGGLIGQALVARHPGKVRALVLSNTAAKIGTAEAWGDRIGKVQAGGIAPLADGIMQMWFSPTFRATPELAIWRNMLTRTDPQGYADACRAIAAADYRTATAGLRLPALAIGGGLDGSTPPALVAETAALIPGAGFRLIEGAGHIPCVESAPQFTAILQDFLKGLPDE
ncbi:MAG: 3-oxoadipate enol-lactonase [Paracoccus sp. (in: a-proteobacteria)]|uniref:3-oxoadipate enol-lactonase n=1 Tax=Paracoccus sp. TaxID=267 RepID=UPI0026DF6C4F|nr:3-oxoadipate enol-lactonase [Paracoccus sp. (in: a-proteobacteria)]MDO5620314.1 3-oxoadipate enol-lactonase [Paracoccus sp. (in: a-proteobacteria)]